MRPVSIPFQNEELREMNATCLRSLRRYIEEAKKSCQILNEVREFPVALEIREKILLQRQSENDAHNDYLVGRQKLFESAQWDR